MIEIDMIGKVSQSMTATFFLIFKISGFFKSLENVKNLYYFKLIFKWTEMVYLT